MKKSEVRLNLENLYPCIMSGARISMGSYYRGNSCQVIPVGQITDLF